MSPRTPRRLGMLPAALVGLLVAALLAGCGAAGRPGAALVVGNRAYTPADVIETTAQINGTLPPGTPPADRATEGLIVNLLVLAQFAVPEAKQRELWAPDNQYNAFLATIHNPTPTTVEALQGSLAFRSLDAQGKAAVLEAMKAARFDIDPRYGTVDYATGIMSVPTPDWIARSTNPAAADK